MESGSSALLTVVTDLGRVRDHNEDAVGVDGWALHGEHGRVLQVRIARGSGSTVVVCDGMGGHLAGEVASRLAAEILSAPLDPEGRDGAADALAARAQAVADQLNRMGEDDEAFSGMGTTAAGVHLAADGSVLAFNVGDSTVLRCADGEARELSEPDVGYGGGLTQALGATRAPLDVHVTPVECGADIAVVMCSDGLTDLVSHEAVAQALRLGDADDRASSDTETAVALVRLACELGGHDNITIAILRFADA
ncbi:PP2C family serine/threonine-protein phosphatase [Rhodococcus sp. HNM0569]|uniref:PP2C family protein-serine/threonine phosphatase n=1 Tax=Rhodococcus sp. HNM0569 TaxID=2716340 RepID=UPI00146DE085|nr:PP2C family serine/threonine-protein phosphatase [Rhodococcus sp. HNM0569]NLU83327.1 serine/threonine-protein phosphatase [Rhodococcus sp. HNM0569]